MNRARLRCSSAIAAAIASATLTLALPASADDGPRFLTTLRGGAATEAGGGATMELRVFDDICIGGSFDLGVNFYGTYGNYSYLGPAAHGSYRLRVTETFELRPFFGARFPMNVSATDGSKYVVTDASVVAFTTALRASFILDYLVVGLQVDFTPHGLTWQEVSTGKMNDTSEYIIRASAVIGIALGGGE